MRTWQLLELMDERDPRTKRQVSRSLSDSPDYVTDAHYYARKRNGSMTIYKLARIMRAYGWTLVAVSPEGEQIGIED